MEETLEEPSGRRDDGEWRERQRLFNDNLWNLHSKSESADVQKPRGSGW